MSYVRVSNPTTGGSAVVHADTVPELELRGWVADELDVDPAAQLVGDDTEAAAAALEAELDAARRQLEANTGRPWPAGDPDADPVDVVVEPDPAEAERARELLEANTGLPWPAGDPVVEQGLDDTEAPEADAAAGDTDNPGVEPEPTEV